MFVCSKLFAIECYPKLNTMISLQSLQVMMDITEPNQGKQTKKIGNYIIDKTLGKGTFGKVKLGIHVLSGEKVAIKILEKDKIIDVADVQRVSRQIHILKLIRHPNIIQLYEIIETPKHLFLVMEYMEKGQLFDYIVQKKRMNQDEACKVFQQIISGVQYIHKLRIVHRDLKLQNLLMDYDKTIRIVDFGLSNTYKIDERLKTACGSPCYAAPQMIQSKNPYQPIMVDVWSAGVILYAMVCGCLPFQDQQTPKLYKKILNGQYSLSSSLSPELQDFIQRILTVDPHKRIRIQAMKNHKWWKKYSNNYYPEGLIVGYHKMPIQSKILQQLKVLNIDVENTEKCIEANRHNNQTTTYYLLLKKYLRDGNISKADFSGKYFDKAAIEPNKRKQRKHSLKPSQIIRKSVSPSSKKLKSKSFYKQNKERVENQSFLERSVKIPKKPKQKQRTKSQNKSKSKIKEKSILNDHINEQQNKDRRLSLNKTSNRSTSKKKRQVRDMSLIAEQPYRPRVRIASTTKNKKSHQGSYLIGSDTAADWPLQPKWKGQTTSKARGALRRR